MQTAAVNVPVAAIVDDGRNRRRGPAARWWTEPTVALASLVRIEPFRRRERAVHFQAAVGLDGQGAGIQCHSPAGFHRGPVDHQDGVGERPMRRGTTFRVGLIRQGQGSFSDVEVAGSRPCSCPSRWSYCRQ